MHIVGVLIAVIGASEVSKCYSMNSKNYCELLHHCDSVLSWNEVR